ncbi:MAG: polysaccharide biosynthesis tyrosine autokinase [Ardenticatenia bacterium]|nr:polysaccharide biosynthesis tyrosine autokinase [Ardenticatenia bacterium]
MDDVVEFQEIDLREYLFILKRWFWAIVLSAILAAATAFFVSSQQQPVYRASGKMYILPAPSAGSGATADYAAIAASERLAQTYAELVRTYPVMERVIQNLGLDLSPAQLAAKVEVSPLRSTALIEVSVRDTDPQRAANIANEVMQVFILQNQALQASRYAASKESLQRQLAEIQAEMERTRARLDALANASTQESVAERQRLEALLAQYRSSYATLLRSYEDVRLAEARSTDNLYVVEAAVPNPSPVAPRTKLNVTVAAAIGIMATMFLAFLKEALDDSVKTGEQATKVTKAPVIGTIGVIGGRSEPAKLVTALNPRSPQAEAFRILRTNVDFASIDTPVHTLLVTSSGPEEGKSTLATNLAIAFAQGGRRVVLLDADLRRPSIHRFFQKANTRGVTTALLQPRRSVTAHLIETDIRGLLLMLTGPTPPNPAELLGSKRMKEMLEGLRTHADIVVIDTPPLLALADTHLLSRLCDAAIVVVDVGSTKIQALENTVEQLRQNGVHLLGLVLNRVTRGRSVYTLQYEYTGYYAESGKRPRRWWRLWQPGRKTQQTAKG